MTIAVFSDIHANLPALMAFFEDVAQRKAYKSFFWLTHFSFVGMGGAYRCGHKNLVCQICVVNSGRKR